MPSCSPVLECSLISGGGDGGKTKAAEKARKEEIEAEKKRIREVIVAAFHRRNVNVCLYVIVWTRGMSFK